MSHFAVAVFHREDQDIDDLLAPYSENLEVEPYIAYTKEQAIQHCKDHWMESSVAGKSDEKLWAELAAEYGNNTDRDGNIYSTYNPNSKWDWYQIGGRWVDFLKLKPNCEYTHADIAYVHDVDFSDDLGEYLYALRFWDAVVDGKQPEDGEEFFSLYNPEFFIRYYGDRETYARRMSKWTTRAVVTPDGVWHEKGEMWWFGLSGESPEESGDWDDHFKERFIDTADPDWVITIVDCHI